MENNEIMEMEEVMDYEIIETEGESSGLSTGGAMLLGAALTAATVAVVKLGKWVWAKCKAHKELRKPEGDVEVDDEDIAKVVE
mgnify:CR=1 FL=1